MNLNKQINELVDTLNDNKSTEDIDTVQIFLDECLVPCDEMRELLGPVHRNYLSFCSHRGYVALPMRWFPDALRDKGLTVKVGRANRFYVHKHYLSNI